MIKVFFADISPLPTKAEGLLLSRYRLEKLAETKLPQKRRQSIGAELLLNHALKKLVPDITPPHEIRISSTGKPEFFDLALQFNISHSKNIVACAVSDKAVGIDIEADARLRPLVAERFFSDKEKALLNQADSPDDVFARIWTGKESAGKWAGTGVARNISLAGDSCGIALFEAEGLKAELMYRKIENLHITVCADKVDDNQEYHFVDLLEL